MSITDNAKNILSFIPGLIVGNTLNLAVREILYYVGPDKLNPVYYTIGVLDLMIVFTVMSVVRGYKSRITPYDEFFIWGIILSHRFYMIDIINDGVRVANQKMMRKNKSFQR